MQDRITSLQDEIATLMHGRPDLAGFTMASRSSVYTTGSDSLSDSGSSFFFTPSVDKAKVYQRLAERLYLLLDYETPLSEAVYDEGRLLNLCADVWGINGKSSLQLNAVVGIWRESILKGQADDERIGLGKMSQSAFREIERKQDGWGIRVREALSDFEADVTNTLDDDDVSRSENLSEKDPNILSCIAELPKQSTGRSVIVPLGGNIESDVHIVSHYGHSATCTTSIYSARRTRNLFVEKPSCGTAPSIKGSLERLSK